MSDINQDQKVFEEVMGIMQTIDGDFPLVQVLEALTFVIAVSARGAQMAPASLVSCFAKTVDQVYAEEEDEFLEH